MLPGCLVLTQLLAVRYSQAQTVARKLVKNSFTWARIEMGAMDVIYGLRLCKQEYLLHLLTSGLIGSCLLSGNGSVYIRESVACVVVN